MSRGIGADQVRSGGQRASDDVLTELRRDEDNPATVDPHDDRTREFTSIGFSRMRLEWRSEDRSVLGRMHDAVDGLVMRAFKDAFEIMNEIYTLVREAESDPTQPGEPLRDQWGWVQWKRTPSGAYIEDFTRMSRREVQHFLFQITTHLFDWEQRAADAWGDAMFAKAAWEEVFARAFNAPMHGTVDDRTNIGRVKSLDQRYFALYLSYYSRKADAVVRSMQNLALRLKDSMV